MAAGLPPQGPPSASSRTLDWLESWHKLLLRHQLRPPAWLGLRSRFAGDSTTISLLLTLFVHRTLTRLRGLAAPAAERFYTLDWLEEAGTRFSCAHHYDRPGWASVRCG